MPVISITRVRVRCWRYIPAFSMQAVRAAFQARAADGNLAVAALREAHNTFWTCTSWASEDAMRAYILASPHRESMRKLAEWCDEASVARWVQETAEPPAWEVVHKRLQSEGWASKVIHPTADQPAFRIPPPVVRRTGALRLK